MKKCSSAEEISLAFKAPVFGSRFHINAAGIAYSQKFAPAFGALHWVGIANLALMEPPVH